MTLPLNIITLGLFWFVVNAVTFALTVRMVNGFDIVGQSLWLITIMLLR
ncbi:phage holin family protein [Brevibacillus sp. B_LB10_24]